MTIFTTERKEGEENSDSSHTCNPSFSGGRDQKDQGSNPAWANSWRDPILKKPNTKKG
jgi:hypothetical protein